MRALIAGSTGLIGGHCLRLLLNDPAYGKVISIGRRKLELTHKKLEQEIVEFERLGLHEEYFAVDHVFCCLGTTIKKAGSQAAFRKVDEEYPLAMARYAEARGASVYSIVTSLGANSSSPIFYSKVKGQVEDALKTMKIPTIHVLQPSMLLGDRDEERTGEKIGQVVMNTVSGLMVGPMRKYRPIEGEQVARAMIALAKKGGRGYKVYPSDQLQKF